MDESEMGSSVTGSAGLHHTSPGSAGMHRWDIVLRLIEGITHALFLLPAAA